MAVSKKRKKNKPPKYRKSKNNEVPEILFDTFHLRYLQHIDEFLIEMVCIDVKNNRKIPIKGYLNAVYMVPGDDGISTGIHIVAPKNWQESELFTSQYVYEMFLVEKQSPNLFSYIKGWFNTTGDMLDDGLFDANKHGELTFDSKGNYFRDKDLDKFIKWEHKYER